MVQIYKYDLQNVLWDIARFQFLSPKIILRKFAYPNTYEPTSHARNIRLKLKQAFTIINSQHTSLGSLSRTQWQSITRKNAKTEK